MSLTNFKVLIIVMKIVINKEEKLWIGVAVESNNGLEAEISGHFGRCPYYVILEVQEGKIKEPVRVIANPYFSSHGEPGQGRLRGPHVGLGRLEPCWYPDLLLLQRRSGHHGAAMEPEVPTSSLLGD